MTSEDSTVAAPGTPPPTDSGNKTDPGDSLSSQRVFKKSSPNNKLTLYLSSRDLVVSAGRIDRLQGVLLVDPEFVENRKVYGQVTLTFRYGREDEEVMGLKFCNEAIMCLAQLYPPHPAAQPPEGNTPLQDALLRRLGSNAHPFSMEITPLAPPSVQLVPAKEYNGAPIGTSYDIRAYVANQADEKFHRKTTVRMGIRVVQRAFAPPSPYLYNPSIFSRSNQKDRLGGHQNKKTLFGCKSAPLEVKFPKDTQNKTRSMEMGLEQQHLNPNASPRNRDEAESTPTRTPPLLTIQCNDNGQNVNVNEEEKAVGVVELLQNNNVERDVGKNGGETEVDVEMEMGVLMKENNENGGEGGGGEEEVGRNNSVRDEVVVVVSAASQRDLSDGAEEKDGGEVTTAGKDSDNEDQIQEQFRSLCGGKRASLAAYLAGVPAPCASVEKPFLLSEGKVHLLASLDKAIYSHGEDVHVFVQIKNSSNKTVRRIKVFVVQHVDVCMFSNGKFKNVVAMISSKEHCPITSNTTHEQTFTLLPIKSSTKNWIALEDSYTKQGTSLASTVTCSTNNPDERNVFAIYVSYYVKVKLLVSVMGGEVSLKLPFTLMHTCSDYEHAETLTRISNKNQSQSQSETKADALEDGT